MNSRRKCPRAPDGEVLVPGYLHEVRNTPHFSKGATTMLELVATAKQ